MNVVSAVPDVGPIATTAYMATNQFGRLNASTMATAGVGRDIDERDQVLPTSSLTVMWTTSPGCQPVPVSVTRPPGG